MIFDKLNTRHIYWGHIAFWIIILFINFSFNIFYPSEYTIEYYYWKIVSNSFFIASFYIAYGLLVPIIIKKENILLKVLKFLLIYGSFIAVDALYIKYLNEVYFEREVQKFQYNILNAIYYTSMYMFMGAFFRLAINGLKLIVQKSQLEKQNLKSELALLRSQINPHFLFNTLNNIHSFTHTDADKTAFSVIKLSEIMRYMLKEANTDKVLLEDEIDYIKSYIALQNIRFSEMNYVEFKIEGESLNKLIAPMIFVPFVENAFKHGDKRQKAPGIKAFLRIEESEIYFEVINFKRKVKSDDIEEKSGFGLENLQRRLELAYPNKFNLKIDDSGEEYITILKIDLNNED